MSIRRGLVLGSLVGSLAWIPPATAVEEPSCHTNAKEVSKKAASKKTDDLAPAAAEVELSDTELVTQDGRTVRFKSDVVGDRIVVMSFVYTSCTTVCPVISSILSGVQTKLGKQLGKDVRLISVTLDPERDTPPKLREYAEKHRASKDWLWITGNSDRVEKVLRELGAYTPNYVTHPPAVLIGDARANKWVRLNGFPSQDQIARTVKKLQSARKGR